MSVNETLRILVVEDYLADAELIEVFLRESLAAPFNQRRPYACGRIRIGCI